MASTATQFGTAAKFGIGADETGMIIESISHDYSNSNKIIKDRTGNSKTVTYYDEIVKVSLKGKLPTTSAFSTTLAAALTLSNGLSGYTKGGVSSGLTLVEGITIDMSNEDYVGISVAATNYPNIAS